MNIKYNLKQVMMYWIRKIDKLADMMSRLDLTKGYRQGKPSSKPYKPYLTPNRGRINSRGRGYDRGRSTNFRKDQSWGKQKSLL